MNPMKPDTGIFKLTSSRIVLILFLLCLVLLIHFNRPGLFSTHKQNINNFYSILKESGTFVIVLTTPGFRDFKSENDQNAERLEEFNNIVMNAARYYHYPFIDVARYLNDVRLTNPDEYRSLFIDSFTFNEKGMQYIADYIFQRLTRVLGSSLDN